MQKYNIVDFWNENGYYVCDLLSEDDISIFQDEAQKLLDKRGEDARPFHEPSKQSKLFDSLFKHTKLIQIVELLMNDKIDGLSTWMYYKPPGELGRDVHQNTFYTKTNVGDIINTSVAFDDADIGNGGLYVYPGSHNEWTLPINIDEDRLLTNPDDWRNERGKPCIIPGNYIDGEWVEKYEKVYLNSKAGQVTFLHSNIIHGSDKNKSVDRWRRAFLANYVRKGAYFYEGGHFKRERVNVYG